MKFEPLLPVAVIGVLGVAGAAWVTFQRPPGTTWVRTGRLLAFVALAVVLLLRPGNNVEAEKQTRLLDVDVVFAIDITTSMAAEDFDGDRTRLAGVQRDMRVLLDDLSGARFSVVTFGADAIVELPFTTDTGAVETIVDSLRAEPYILARGSSIERPVGVLEDLFEDVEEDHPDRARVLVVITDGEEINDDGDRDGSYSDLAEYIDSGLVLGYGTSGGGRMKQEEVTVGSGDDYVRDSDGDIAISKIDEDNLKEVAADLEVEYEHRTSPGGLDDAFDPGTLEVEMTGETLHARVDAAWIPGIALGLLVLWELWELTVTGRATRRWWAR